MNGWLGKKKGEGKSADPCGLGGGKQSTEQNPSSQRFGDPGCLTLTKVPRQPQQVGRAWVGGGCWRHGGMMACLCLAGVNLF